MVCAGKHLRRSARRARDGRPGRERRSSAVRASEAHRGPVAAGNGADGARERDGRYRGGGPIRRSSGEWWEGSERPLDSNVRTRKSRSWPVQSCERSVCDEDRNPVLGGLIEDGRAMLTVFTTHCARWATPRGGAAEAETARFAINTSFAALRGARTRPAGPDVSFEGADASPLPPIRRRTGERGPQPKLARRAYARRAPHRCATGPRCARSVGAADGHADALVPQMAERDRWCCRWPTRTGVLQAPITRRISLGESAHTRGASALARPGPPCVSANRRRAPGDPHARLRTPGAHRRGAACSRRRRTACTLRRATSVAAHRVRRGPLQLLPN